MLNLLNESLIQVVLSDRSSRTLCLPAVYEALGADKIESFAALRPHQRHPWHALLCQLGALACLRAHAEKPPADADGCAAMLRALTPDHPDDAPWCLVSPDDKPAFLQPVVGPAAGLKPAVTPDELDMLVTAKNHDLKGSRMTVARPDDWLFALVALQTSEGFLGAGNFGASKMNGGFANRPGLGLAPPGGVGAHVFRDIGRLIALRDEILNAHIEYDPDGPALIWLTPWDGTASLPRRGLHPYYIEICRRVRLVSSGGVLSARVGNSKAPRIFMAKEEGGVTGDPWTPVASKEGLRKALTVDARGFDYRRLAGIMFGGGYEPARLQRFAEGEDGEGWSLVCRAITRGQGKTEGYHERRVPIPAPVARMFEDDEVAEIADLAAGRIREVRTVQSCLRYGLMVMFQNGPDRTDFKPRDPSSGRRAEVFLDRFQKEVDRTFFEALFQEAQETTDGARTRCRKNWLKALLQLGEDILRDAEASSPTSIVRRHRAWVRADGAFKGAFRSAEDLRPYFAKEAADAA